MAGAVFGPEMRNGASMGCEQLDRRGVFQVSASGDVLSSSLRLLNGERRGTNDSESMAISETSC